MPEQHLPLNSRSSPVLAQNPRGQSSRQETVSPVELSSRALMPNTPLPQADSGRYYRQQDDPATFPQTVFTSQQPHQQQQLRFVENPNTAPGAFRSQSVEQNPSLPAAAMPTTHRSTFAWFIRQKYEDSVHRFQRLTGFLHCPLPASPAVPRTSRFSLTRCTQGTTVLTGKTCNRLATDDLLRSFKSRSEPYPVKERPTILSSPIRLYSCPLRAMLLPKSVARFARYNMRLRRTVVARRSDRLENVLQPAMFPQQQVPPVLQEPQQMPVNGLVDVALPVVLSQQPVDLPQPLVLSQLQNPTPDAPHQEQQTSPWDVESSSGEEEESTAEEEEAMNSSAHPDEPINLNALQAQADAARQSALNLINQAVQYGYRRQPRLVPLQHNGDEPIDGAHSQGAQMQPSPVIPTQPLPGTAAPPNPPLESSVEAQVIGREAEEARQETARTIASLTPTLQANERRERQQRARNNALIRSALTNSTLRRRGH